jgi:hypothetical protein
LYPFALLKRDVGVSCDLSGRLTEQLKGGFMKQLIVIFNTFVLLVAISVAVEAQTARIFEIEIPFDFIIKDRTVPAGRYSIGRPNEQNPDLLLFRKADGKTNVLIVIQRALGDPIIAGSMLSFNRYGEKYFLKSVGVASERYAGQLVMGTTERKLRVLNEATVISLFESPKR